MDVPDKLDEIAAEASDAIDALLRRAFEAGRSQGKREAANQFRERLMRVVDGDDIDDEPELPVPNNVEEAIALGPALQDAARAAPGSVKPTIMRLVSERPGLTTAEIQSVTGIKKNSVRGTLWTLGAEDAVYRDGSRWFPQVKTNRAADEQSSAAPISQPIGPFAGDRQADPSEPGREVAHHNMLE